MRFSYDPNGNVSQVMQPGSFRRDPADVHHFDYGLLDFPPSYTPPDVGLLGNATSTPTRPTASSAS